MALDWYICIVLLVRQTDRQGRKKEGRLFTCEVVVMCPDLLQAYDVGRGVGNGELVANLAEPSLPLFGYIELEAPAVEGEEVDFCRAWWVAHCSAAKE